MLTLKKNKIPTTSDSFCTYVVGLLTVGVGVVALAVVTPCISEGNKRKNVLHVNLSQDKL